MPRASLEILVPRLHLDIFSLVFEIEIRGKVNVVVLFSGGFFFFFFGR